MFAGTAQGDTAAEDCHNWTQRPALLNIQKVQKVASTHLLGVAALQRKRSRMASPLEDLSCGVTVSKYSMLHLNND